ncbi:MAG: DUF362 domain-containing protein [Deltaproteobacteria bacterium]|nr:MAG: DUF362 domain-containing protein [Deltaproteobacteria bacterium]
MPTSVAIVKGNNGRDLDDVRRMMTNLFALIGPPSKIIPPGSRVLIKVNLTAEEKLWDKGILTSPLFTRALVEEVQKARPAEVIIAEGAAVGQDTKRAFAANGYPEVAKATGARLLDLYDGEHQEVKTCADGVLKTVRISKEVLKADFFINAPVLKTHFASTLTGAMKNLKGTTTYDEKKRFHYLNLNQAVAELNQVLKPNLIVIDGTIAMEGDGPVAGTPVELNLIMAGTDAVAVDTIAARIMDIDPEEVAPLAWAKKMGFGVGDETEIRILGNSIAEVFRAFKRSCAPLKIDAKKIEFIDGQACNACRDGLRIALERLQASGVDLDRLPELKISLGSKASLEGSEGWVQVPIGNCQNQYKHLPNFVPGCPPPTFLMADQIREMLGEKRKFGEKKSFFMDR